jgi:hypothetical protein
LAAGALDLARVAVPSTRRQVNAYWIGRYRGWVVGVGFGFQLGLGIGTIVTTAAVYGTLLAAFLTADPLAGAVVGAVFGLARSVAVLPARRVRSSAELFRVSAWLDQREALAARVAGVASAIVGMTVLLSAF